MSNLSNDVRIRGRVLRIAQLDAELFHFVEDPVTMIDRLRNDKSRVDIFTFVQGLPEAEPKFGYHMEWENLAVLPISTFEHWWSKQIRSGTKNRARQAERKGVVIREVEFDEKLVRGIWEIYNESPVRQGRRFRHYGKDFEVVHREAATYVDYSTFIGAFLGEELIGFIKMVTDENRVQAGLMNILSKARYKDKAPTNALLSQAVRSCADRGIAYLVYNKYNYGKKQHDGLSEFKERNGFRRVEVPRYYVPLTQFGELALRMGFHRRLVDHLPESIAARLRELRKNWYGRGLQSAGEAS
jgi:hypothetical protein